MGFPLEEKKLFLLQNVCLRITRGYPPSGSDGKVSACNVGDLSSIPGLGRLPGEGNGNPLQYSCLEDPMDGGAWWATYSPCDRKESDKTERLHFHFHPNLMLYLSRVFAPHLCAFEAVWSSASDLTLLRLACKVGWEQRSLTNVCEDVMWQKQASTSMAPGFHKAPTTSSYHCCIGGALLYWMVTCLRPLFFPTAIL